MRFLKYILLAANLTLTAINLGYLENTTYAYFGFVPSEYVRYLFAEKTIEIDGERVNLPPGYFLEEYKEDADIGPIYTLRKYDLSIVTFTLFRPLQQCLDYFIEDYTKDLCFPNYTNFHDVTQVLFCYYKFNNTGIAVRRSAEKFYHYQFGYSYDAVIPDKCINIWAMGDNIDINEFLELVKSIVFAGETGEFEVVDCGVFKENL